MKVTFSFYTKLLQSLGIVAFSKRQLFYGEELTVTSFFKTQRKFSIFKKTLFTDTKSSDMCNLPGVLSNPNPKIKKSYPESFLYFLKKNIP